MIVTLSCGKQQIVFNPFTDRWVDFDYFKEHFYDFPLTTRMLYASFINDKELLICYGFL